MKHFLLKPKRSIIPSDFTFLAKIPLIPNQYLWKDGLGKLALLKEADSESLLLLTNQDAFLKQYTKYYQQHFEMEELEETPDLESYDLIYGEHSISQAFAEGNSEEDY